MVSLRTVKEMICVTSLLKDVTTGTMLILKDIGQLIRRESKPRGYLYQGTGKHFYTGERFKGYGRGHDEMSRRRHRSTAARQI